MQIKPYSPIGLLILLETMLLYACTADESDLSSGK